MHPTVENARDLAAVAAKRAEQTDRDRCVPADLVDELRAGGCLSMVAPVEFGGSELALTDVLEVVETLAKGDGSVGWIAGQAAMAQVVLSRFPHASVERVYAAGAGVIGCGAAAPKGKARRTADGWRVSGRWPFATGVLHASWFYGQCVAFGPGVESSADGVPQTRMAILWPDEYEVVDNWSTTGLRGTGSHDVVVARRDCPPERTAVLTGSTPTLDRAAYRVPAVEYSGFVVAATGVGIAAGAIDAVIELATGGKRPSFSPRRLAESPVFQDRLGEAVLVLAGARAQLAEQARRFSALAAAGEVPGVHDRAQQRATCHYVAACATRASDTAHVLAGGSAVYEGNPLERRLRDAHMVTQHATTARESVKVLGALHVGETDPSLMW